MIPEGLQYSSIADIVSKIKSLDMNVIRLTYAIEMIDNIFENDGVDVKVSDALNTALGSVNGSLVFAQIMENNPSLGSDVTRLQVFDAVAAECFNQEIYVHLDNHVSKGIWCCATDDGNSWFGDTFFSAANWTRGLGFMASHGEAWGNLMSMGMRNELRSPDDNTTLVTTEYGWSDWYTNMIAAATTIHGANTNPLIFFSGLGFDTDMTPIPTGAELTDAAGVATPQTFIASSFPFADKIVIEIHNYDGTATSCSDLEDSLISTGYDAMVGGDGIINVVPVVMTEFGYANDNTTWETVYPTCLSTFLPGFAGGPAGWMVWVLAGSYYIRQGCQDCDETWGLLTHDWSDFRSTENIDNLIMPMVQASLA